VKVSGTYPRFALIDGDHDFKQAVPDGYVEYSVRKLHGGRVAYFNFALGKEMGLIERDHLHRLNPQLEEAILDTFPLQVVNEYDLLHKTPIPKKDIRPKKYMATRYLQLQHASRQGKTSGDGRSIWNGQISHKGITWDVTSCGTGSTCLSPAAAKLGFIPKTGDPSVSYGCGKADVQEGTSAAILSEIFHRSGIPTERTLAIIEFEDGTSINVRAGTCLLRPSHFFHHLKQGNYDGLKGAIDYFIRRQAKNKGWGQPTSAHDLAGPGGRYYGLARKIAIEFARMAATFESEYVFVWMDWDGDNILANAGIIDYGSVRQFGLYHHHYRFDDGDRWSTTLPEQRLKARETVQAFIQIASFLHSGRKRNIKRFRKHPILRLFDREFERATHHRMLGKLGFDERQSRFLLEERMPQVQRFRKAFSYFERATRPRKHRTADGVTRDALYCMRDAMRELPARWLRGELTDASLAGCRDFLKLVASQYASTTHVTPTFQRCLRVREYFAAFDALLETTGRKFAIERASLLSGLSTRAAEANPRDRITGESILYVTEKLLRARRRGLKRAQLQDLIEKIVHALTLGSPVELEQRGAVADRVFQQALRLVGELRQSL
jgi:uncharacterized protein YdiU (UPF0061 family)